MKESLPNQRVRVGQPFSYTVPADWLVTDNGEPAMLDTRRLPAWLRFDAATRTFSGTPTLADAKQPAIPLHLKTASGERATANWWVDIYETYQQPPANADFSEGDTGWDKGTGFAIVEKDGRHVAQARIGKTFDIVNNDWAVIRPGVKIRAEGWVDIVGWAGSASASGQVLLNFYDAAGQLIRREAGSMVSGETGSGRSTLETVAPAGAAYVALGGTARSRVVLAQSDARPVTLSDFRWVFPEQASLVMRASPPVRTAWYAFDANNQVTVMNGDLVDGQVVLKQAENSTAFDYDTAGRVIRRRSLEAGVHTARDLGYDALGRKTRESKRYTVGERPAEIAEGWRHDALGRVTAHRTYDENGLKRLNLTDYDADGRQLRQLSFGRSLDGAGQGEEAIGEG
ncbi:hypothetical protein EBB59_13085, partial [Lysobacter pythonis]